MKYLKYLVIALAIVGILAGTSWYLRNSIIQRLSSPLLQQYDIEIVDVSLDSLAGNQARIGKLELLYAGKTTIVIENLRTPLNTQKDAQKTYSASRVSISTQSQDDAVAVALAQLVDQFHSLTSAIPLTRIQIAEFSMAPYPVVRDLDWRLSESTQEISATIDSLQLAVADIPVDSAVRQLSVSVRGVPGMDNLALEGIIQRDDQSITFSGDALLDLPSWQPLAKLAGVIPQAVDISAGAATLTFRLLLPHDPMLAPGIELALTPESPWQLAYMSASGTATDMLVTDAATTTIEAEFPAGPWSLELPRASVAVSDGEWKAIPVQLANISCNSMQICGMETSIRWPNPALPFGRAKSIDLSSSMAVFFDDDAVRVEVAAGAEIAVNALTTNAADIGVLTATVPAAATFTVLESGWTFAAEAVDASITALSVGDNAQLKASMFLENMSVSEQNGISAASMGLYTPAIQAGVDSRTIELPGLKGNATVSGANFQFDLETIGLQQNGTLLVRHNTEFGAGNAKIDRAGVSFATKKMSARYRPWQNDWDLVGGLVGLDGEANWRTSADELVVDGKALITLSDAAGFYADTAFTGLSTTLALAYTDREGITTQPASIRVALVEMGLPIEDLTANYRLDLNDLSVDVENLRMRAFGGTVRADPFSFRTASERNNLTLYAELIRLDEVLSLKEFEAVSVTGSVNATLPVTIANGEITVTGGQLSGEAPGGVIRYRAGNAPPVTSTSSIDLVARALSNFVYETLTSQVDYNEAGDLILKMQIKGRNPDMEGNRPVILNLGVENNVPQMIRSLQAARAVEEVLEKRVRK